MLEDDMLGADLRAFAEQHDHSDGVMQLPEVARPLVSEKLVHGSGMNGGDRLVGGGSLWFQFHGDKAGQILGTVAQRRDAQGQNGQGMIEGLPKTGLRRA